jgi:hypothetical protein
MWDDAKQQRLNELQQRAQSESLHVDDQQVLDELLHELEQEEWAAVRPALSEFRRDQEALQAGLGRLQAQNAVLAALAERYADLLRRVKVQLAGFTSEREALRTEYERALH